MKYKHNLKIKDDKVFSYGRHAATIWKDQLHAVGIWDKNIMKHLSHVAAERDLKLIRMDQQVN